MSRRLGRFVFSLAIALLPMTDAGGEERPAVVVERGIVYGHAGDRPLHLDMCRKRDKAEGLAPAVVFIHGGGWGSGSKADYLNVILGYAEQGYVSVSIEYRLTGEAVFPAQIHDCKAAVRFLRAHAKKYGIDPERIGASGYSAGAHLASLLGTSGDVRELEGECGWPEQSSRVQAVCAYSVPSDFPAMASPEEIAGKGNPDAHDAMYKLFDGPISKRMDLAKAASPTVHATADDPPFLIIHGTKDELVPFEQATLLRDALKKNGTEVELVPLEGGGHVDWRIWSWEIISKEMAFFARYLKATR